LLTPRVGAGRRSQQWDLGLAHIACDVSEHQNPGEATVFVLRGCVRLRSGAESWQGKAGDLLIVPDGLHSLEAEEDSAILMTVAKIKT